MDVKCPLADIKPDCIVLAVTTRALKHNGGCPKEEINDPSIEYLTAGLPNLEVHIENLKQFTTHIIVALNKFATDTPDEVELIKRHCDEKLPDHHQIIDPAGSPAENKKAPFIRGLFAESNKAKEKKHEQE